MIEGEGDTQIGVMGAIRGLGAIRGRTTLKP